jgi:hypothetical protein
VANLERSLSYLDDELEQHRGYKDEDVVDQLEARAEKEPQTEGLHQGGKSSGLKIEELF